MLGFSANNLGTGVVTVGVGLFLGHLADEIFGPTCAYCGLPTAAVSEG
jgi:hypothetical protein